MRNVALQLTKTKAYVEEQKEYYKTKNQKKNWKYKSFQNINKYHNVI